MKLSMWGSRHGKSAVRLVIFRGIDQIGKYMKDFLEKEVQYRTKEQKNGPSTLKTIKCCRHKLKKTNYFKNRQC